MANGHGGYRRPANPAPVSGPGAHSRRTDGKQPIMDMPDAAYGENANFTSLQQASPLPQASLSGPMGGPMPAGPGPQLVGLGAPTQEPNVPVTNGAAAGPGAGPAALGLGQDPNSIDSAIIAKYLPFLMKQAEDPDATPGYKAWLRNLIANLPQQ
jgi:hypothetical protein